MPVALQERGVQHSTALLNAGAEGKGREGFSLAMRPGRRILRREPVRPTMVQKEHCSHLGIARDREDPIPWVPYTALTWWIFPRELAIGSELNCQEVTHKIAPFDLHSNILMMKFQFGVLCVVVLFYELTVRLLMKTIHQHFIVCLQGAIWFVGGIYFYLFNLKKLCCTVNVYNRCIMKSCRFYV